MLKSKLERFIAKRVLIFFVVLAIIDIVLIDKRWLVLLGLFIGGAFSVLRFGSYAFLFARLLAPLHDGNEKRKYTVLKSSVVFIINQSILLLLLYLAFRTGIYYFVGMVSGILLVPFVLVVNGITEALKITNNNFE